MTPDGARCYLSWEASMLANASGDRLQPMDWDAPNQVQCPPKAKELLDARPMSDVIGMNPPAPK